MPAAVPVLWVSRHENILARGYADEGLLDDLLSGTLWQPPGGLRFTHMEAVGEAWPDLDGEGAVVILPARHHDSPPDVSWFLERLDTLPWSLVILAGDEEWAFPWRQVVETPTRRVWTMQPIPGHEELSGMLPGGWSPGTRRSFARYADRADTRPLGWFFAGQVTHDRREACAEVMRTMAGGELIETDGYMRGIPVEEYREKMAGAKVVPCPSGPYTVDTNRPLEAMEVGAVPIVDLLKPREPQFDYWKLLFGEVPFPKTAHWEDLPGEVAKIESAWPRAGTEVHAWWQQWKRHLAHRMFGQIEDLAGSRHGERPDDLITVIVTTSPTPQHPATTDIEETIESIRRQLPEAEIIVVADGVHPGDVDRRDDYETYLRRLCWLTNFRWRNVVPLLMPRWVHQANATRAALDMVTTPLVLFVEHDTPLCGDIDWPGLCGLVRSGTANAVRLHIFHEVLAEHEHLMLDAETQWINGVPVRRTAQWWQRPHLASATFYRQMIMPLFPERSRTYVEDLVYGLLESAWRDRGEEGWEPWKLWVYTPEGDMTRSRHLDSRDGAEKYPVSFR